MKFAVQVVTKVVRAEYDTLILEPLHHCIKMVSSISWYLTDLSEILDFKTAVETIVVVSQT